MLKLWLSFFQWPTPSIPTYSTLSKCFAFSSHYWSAGYMQMSVYCTFCSELLPLEITACLLGNLPLCLYLMFWQFCIFSPNLQFVSLVINTVTYQKCEKLPNFSIFVVLIISFFDSRCFTFFHFFLILIYIFLITNGQSDFQVLAVLCPLMIFLWKKLFSGGYWVLPIL